MQVIRSKQFNANTAWASLPISNINGISTRLHWTDQAYVWHSNMGDEVFVVLDGSVKMHYQENAQQHYVILNSGDIFHVQEGVPHKAEPQGEARVLVIEQQHSA